MRECAVCPALFGCRSVRLDRIYIASHQGYYSTVMERITGDQVWYAVFIKIRRSQIKGSGLILFQGRTQFSRTNVGGQNVVTIAQLDCWTATAFRFDRDCIA